MDIADRGSVLLLRDRLYSIFFIRIITEPRDFSTGTETRMELAYLEAIYPVAGLSVGCGEMRDSAFWIRLFVCVSVIGLYPDNSVSFCPEPKGSIIVCI